MHNMHSLNACVSRIKMHVVHERPGLTAGKRPLVMADNEYYTVELFDWITETSPYDLLVPMPNNSSVRRSIEQVAEPYIPGYTGVLLVVLTYYYSLGFLILTGFAFIATLIVDYTISKVKYGYLLKANLIDQWKRCFLNAIRTK